MEELSLLPSAALRKELSSLLGLTAGNLLRLAVIVGILEDRGEDLSALKGGFLNILRKIACGELLPDLVVLFSAEPAKIQQAAKLPITDQQEIANGRQALPARKRTYQSQKGIDPSAEPIGNAGTVAAALREMSTRGTPKDVADAAASMLLACNDRQAAADHLVAMLTDAGIRIGGQPEPKKLPAVGGHKTTYWADRTKAEDE